jgi:P pilus assembly chaperone PapD
MTFAKFVIAGVAGLAAAIMPFSAAHGQLALSQLIVELQPAGHVREDIEVSNNGPERAYVSVEPAEIVAPGTSSEKRRQEPDPEKLGLLVTPARMILEPGQRKLVRVAAIAPVLDRERVYRVTVKPVVGALASDKSGLKILVGYDMLVLVRPAQPRPNVVASRDGNSLTFRNEGNVSVELTEGKQCDPSGKQCIELPGKRLYPAAEWRQPLKSAGPVEYSIKSAGQIVRNRY